MLVLLSGCDVHCMLAILYFLSSALFAKRFALVGLNNIYLYIYTYCKFGNFRVTFISRIFYLRIISEFLNSRVSVHVFYNVYSDSLLARTLNSRGN